MPRKHGYVALYGWISLPLKNQRSYDFAGAAIQGCAETVGPTPFDTAQRRPVRVLTSTQTANTRMLPLTIICQ